MCCEFHTFSKTIVMFKRRRGMLKGLEFVEGDKESNLEIKYPNQGEEESSFCRDKEVCDPHYEIFLNHTKQERRNAYVTTLEENGLLTFIYYERDESSRYDDDVCDPGYVFFLKNTKREGMSYVTTLEENGVQLCIYYEKEDSCRAERNDDCTYILKKDRKGDEGEKNGSEIVKAKRIRFVSTGIGSHDPPLEEEDEIVKLFTPLSTGKRPEVLSSGAGNLDPPMVGDDGKAMFQEIKKRNAKSKPNREQRSSLTRDDERFVDQDYAPLLQAMKMKENGSSKPFTPLSTGKRATLPEIQKCNAKSKPNKERRSSSTRVDEKYVDPDYALFLRVLKMQYEMEASKSESQKNQDVEYDSDDESGDDVVEINHATFHNAVSSEVHYFEVGEAIQPGHKEESSQFRQMVISVLKKPFDQTEYENLLHAIEVQKPVEKNLELRHGRDRSCPSSKKGKSLLEHHEELNKKLKEASPNKYEMLNILRGFFFWLQYAPHAWAFQPWKDPICLSVMPG